MSVAGGLGLFGLLDGLVVLGLGGLHGLQGHGAELVVEALGLFAWQLGQAFQDQVHLVEVEGVVDRHFYRVEWLCHGVAG